MSAMNGEQAIGYVTNALTNRRKTIMKSNKPIICKYCSAVDQHHSFQCHTQRKPIKSKGTQIGNYTMTSNKTIATTKAKIKDKSPSEIPTLLREAEKYFNAFIRKRDSFEGRFVCISSGKELDVKFMQAGHYFPKTYSALRFDEDNVHGESIESNCMDWNHLKGYRVNLINKIGRVRYDALYAKKMIVKKWTREELLEIINKYK